MQQLSTADLDALDRHFTGDCPGCRRCDLYPAVTRGEPWAVEAYVRYMVEAHGEQLALVESDEPAPAPADTRRCLRCGSDKVIADARIEDRSETGPRALEANLGATRPDALLFTAPLRVELRADICGACGHVEVRVDDPAAVWAAFCKLPPQERP